MRRLWIGLLIVTSLISVFFLGVAGGSLKSYFSLNSKARVLSINWDIVEKAPDSFALSASYMFLTATHQEIKGGSEFNKPYFLNRLSAEQAVRELQDKTWEVFYDKTNPRISSLQKIFPFKECAQALITLGIFIYFIFFKNIFEKARQEW